MGWQNILLRTTFFAFRPKIAASPRKFGAQVFREGTPEILVSKKFPLKYILLTLGGLFAGSGVKKLTARGTETKKVANAKIC